MQKWILTPRQRCDLEMLLIGAFDPLKGFISQADYESVLSDMRLADGTLWPTPITLDVTDQFANDVSLGNQIGLYNTDNTLLATMTITDKWQPDKKREALGFLGTTDITHPSVNYLFNKTGNWYLGGPVKLVNFPAHYDFLEIRHTPESLKNFFQQLGWEKIVAFQTRNPMHRAHMELTLRAAKQINGNLLIHPVVGLTKPGDVDYLARVRCYRKLLQYYPANTATLSLLPLAMRMAGPKEALWHAIIRKNYGCTHFIVGRDHAGPGKDASGKPFYHPYAAQELTQQHQDEIGIQILPFQEMIYVKERQKYVAINEVKENETAMSISGTEFRDALLNDKTIPEWFSYPEVVNILRKMYPPLHRKGLTVFFTGLSGAGKTTIASALQAKLVSEIEKNVSILDGDEIRPILSKGLGFSREDRNTNVERIGFVASEITKAGGIALCAVIAPYREARQKNRDLISQYGGYVEVYVATPIDECEKRDTKGFYKKARQGEMKGFTGVDDPYEIPENADIVIDTSTTSLKDAVEIVFGYLQRNGYIKIENEEMVSLGNAVV